MKSRIDKAIEYIRGYCQKHDNCDGCKLECNKSGCDFRNWSIPADWETPSERKKK